MAKHPYWRIVALLIAVTIILLIFQSLIKNSEEKLKEMFTADFGYTITSLLSDLSDKIDLEELTLEDNQKIITMIQSRYKDVQVLALVKGKNFFTHTDTLLTGKKITKEIFDAQTELKKNLVASAEDTPYVIWQEDEKAPGVFAFYYPLRTDDKLTGLAYIKIGLQSMYPVKINGTALFIALLIFLILTLWKKDTSFFGSMSIIQKGSSHFIYSDQTKKVSTVRLVKSMNMAKMRAQRRFGGNRIKYLAVGKQTFFISLTK